MLNLNLYKKISVGHFDYIVFKCGRILKLNSNKFLSHRKEINGYIRVAFQNFKNPEVKKEYLHRVIYHVFNPNSNINIDIHHIDGCRDNNDLSNLQCITHKENMNLRVFLNDNINREKRQIIATKTDGTKTIFPSLSECFKTYPSRYIYTILKDNEKKRTLKCGTTFSYN